MTDLLMQVSTPGRTWIFAAESAEDRVSWQSTLHMMLDDIRERKKRQVHLGHLSRLFISAAHPGYSNLDYASRLFTPGLLSPQALQEGVTILKEGWADLKDETQARSRRDLAEVALEITRDRARWRLTRRVHVAGGRGGVGGPLVHSELRWRAEGLP